VKKVGPDAVILAVGGKPTDPDIPSENGNNVISTHEMKSKAQEFVRLFGPKHMGNLSKLFLPTGKKVVVVGGDLAGMEAVEFLTKRGKEVTLVESDEQIGKGALIHWMIRYMPWLQARGIPVYAGVTYNKVTKDGLVITTAEGEEKLLEADMIMVMTQYTRNDDLYNALDGVVEERFLAGDAKRDDLAWIHGSVRDGANAGLAV